MKLKQNYLRTKIPYNMPHLTHKEMGYISHSHALGQLSGDGYYTAKCQELLKKSFKTELALLTHSCSAAMEMMAILADIHPGDEVIIPSFTFSSTANAIALRGGVPVFIDIRPDTLNMDEKLVRNAITKKTKALFPVHYAGVGCEMDSLLTIAKKHKLFVFEDAAQGLLATYKGKYLGTIGDLGAYSFHETKNIISGEGGALLINKEKYSQRAEIIREKGTDRSRFFRGEVDKYTWVDIGSSYLPSEIIAAFLFAQLEQMKSLTRRRLIIWERYHRKLEKAEKQGLLRRPIIPAQTTHNGHIYYILVENRPVQEKLLTYLKQKNILAITHYMPLHSSRAGKKFGRYVGDMRVTNRTVDTLIRLPIFYDLSFKDQDYVIKSIYKFFT